MSADPITSNRTRSPTELESGIITVDEESFSMT
jgi:hypothetical protein